MLACLGMAVHSLMEVDFLPSPGNTYHHPPSPHLPPLRPRRDFIVNGKGDPAAADNNGTASGAAKADAASGEPTTGDAPVKMDVDA